MRGDTVAALDVSEHALQGLKQNRQILVIVPGTVFAALGTLEQLQAYALAEGIPVTVRKSNGNLQVRRADTDGSVRVLTERQISYGQLRGLSLDLVMHGDDKLLPEILPALIVRQGIAVNYMSGAAAHTD